MRNKKKLSVIIMLALFCAGMMISCTHRPQNQVSASVSFSNDIVPIFSASCALNSSCHLGANGANDGVALDSAEAYSCIINKGLISVSDPQSSLLYAEISTDEMPKPPDAPLAASQQAMILQWIEQGAKNN